MSARDQDEALLANPPAGNPRRSDVTLVAGAPPGGEALSGLARLAFGSQGSFAPAGEGRHLAFLPLDTLELDLDDPQQRDFGDYELRAQLGQGGMGVVYRAWQRSLQREVAIKLLAAGPWASAAFVARFQREAQSAARLQHPNIVPVYEIGQHAELNFFSMGLVRGESLAQKLDRDGPFAPRAAARLLRVVAETLDYAHRLGILHLDLKPANVLLDENGEPLVADFGLSRRLDESLASDGDEVSGTPSYMAPEQATAKRQRIGVGTDIYGLGAILYEVLTGRPPFLAATPRMTLEQVVTREAAAPRDVDGRVPADLSAICARCLAKDPAQRYATARGLAEDLQRFLEGRAVSVRPLHAGQRLARWARREPRVALAAGAALAALLAGLVATGLQWQRADANARIARAHLWSARAQASQAALAQGDGFRGLRPLVENLAEMEADGRGDGAALERRRIGTVLANAPRPTHVLRLPQGVAASAVAIAPDASRFAVATHAADGSRRIVQYALPGGEELTSTPTDDLTHVLPFSDGLPHGELRYSPDGTRLLAMLLQQPVLPAPQRSDGIAIDARDGRVLWPPGGTPHADIVYSEDMRVALVRYRSDASIRFPDTGQFFDVGEAWQPIGPRHDLGVDGAGHVFLPTPDGAHWLATRDSVHFTLREKGTMRAAWAFTLPDADQARAWRFNADATKLAVGTVGGVVYLFDTRTQERWTLPGAPIATVRWVEFAPGGATLAAQAEDGSITAWDVATRRPRTPPLAPGIAVAAPRAVFDGETLFAPFGNEIRAWTLTPPAPFDNVALPGAARPRNRRHFHAYGVDVHPAARMLVTGGSDGTVVRWALPPAAMTALRAAPLPAATAVFDGRHVAAVDGTLAWRASLDGGAEAPRLRHPAPVRVAELTGDGRYLATVAGRTLRVFDAATGALRGAPLVLPQTPLRVELARDAAVMAFTTGRDDGAHLREDVHFADLERVAWRAPPQALDGPLESFALDPRGRFVLAMARHADGRHAVVTTVPADGAAAPCAFPGDFALALASTLAPDGAHAWVLHAMPGRVVRLQRWDLSTCRAVAGHEFPGFGRTPWLLARGDDVVAHRIGGDALVRFGADGTQHAAGVAVPGSMLEFALSGDGARAAFATRGAAHLVDARTGERLSAPLAAPIPGNDAIAKLAFSPDGERLLARTIRGRWLRWELPKATQPVAELAALAAFLDPDTRAANIGDVPVLQDALAPAARAASAAPTVIELAPTPDDAPDPRYVPLDLGAAINVPLAGAWPRQRATGGDLVTLAPGPQRLLDIDWRVDGGVQLSAGGAAVTIHPEQRASADIALPPLRARRLHVLALMHIPLSGRATPRDFVHAVLRDDAGREARIALRTLEHVVTHGMPERAAASARTAWLGMPSSPVREGEATSSQTLSHVYASAFDLPPSLGPLASLRFEVTPGSMEAPLVFAATLEREWPDPPE